jgi:hypothetical protein
VNGAAGIADEARQVIARGNALRDTAAALAAEIHRDSQDEALTRF